MSYFKIENLYDKTESLFKLVVVAAKRALEISNGAKKLVDIESTDPSTIALEEIKEGKVMLKQEDNSKEDNKEKVGASK